MIWVTDTSGTIDLSSIATVAVDALTSAELEGASYDASVLDARSFESFAGDHGRVSRSAQCTTVDSVATERRSVGVKAGVRADP